MISLAKEYIKWLCEREQGLFPEPLKESVLTETDILEIERGLGYALPEQYREEGRPGWSDIFSDPALYRTALVEAL